MDDDELDNKDSMEQQTTSTQLTLNEAYHLRKAGIVEQLKKRGIEVNESVSRDSLREQLVKVVRNSSSSSESEEEISDQGSGSGPSRSSNFIDFHNINSEVITSDSDATRAAPIFFDVKINGKIVAMEFDSGTYFSVMSEGFVNKTFGSLKVTSSKTKLISYENKTMESRGQLKNLTVTFNNKTKVLSCLVLKGDKIPLIGRQWLSIFGLWPLERLLHSDIVAKSKIGIYSMQAEGVRESMLKEFEKLFSDTPGVYNKRKVKIHIKPNVKPVALGARHMPYALRPKTEQELERMQAEGVRESMLQEFEKLFSDTPGVYNKRKVKIHIKPNVKPVALGARHMPYALRPKTEQELERLVKLGNLKKVESSEWATPIVPIQRSNGKIRLDLPHAYMQCEVEDESQKYLTITTHKGLYQYTRLSEGISIAPSEFTHIMSECLQGIPNVINYMENIYVTGKTNDEHVDNLRTVCQRLLDRGIRLNRDKCEFMKNRIEVLGFVIDKDGLHKAKSKVVAMYEAPCPENTKQLESFLGLINFYERFLKNKSAQLKP
ncbi:uncharacterized protein LOC117169773 [Belonocnema kinseyi]|uniref:uncharacterized protein LOC117169773 n=1 Tax=Belonocnema kinseyi TaxID=2817044 RepID=UPI00143DAB66|nr:uncharacterized protein LOC117169773 [Belonocnema kinseyi]